MRISDWSSDVCSSDLHLRAVGKCIELEHPNRAVPDDGAGLLQDGSQLLRRIGSNIQNLVVVGHFARRLDCGGGRGAELFGADHIRRYGRSEEHTTELQSLMRISYAVFCLKKKNEHTQ